MMKIFLFISVLSLCSVCSADIITVDDNGPADYSKIQDAINDANNDDTIIVQPGTYTGTGNKNLDFAGKTITVQSTDPNDSSVVAATIIDCENSGRGFYFHSGEDGNSTVDGLTIKRGYAANGGAIYCVSASPTIRNCVITANKSQNGANAQNGGNGYHGGGIYCQSSSARFENCSITSNGAGNGGYGWSVYIEPPVGMPGSGGAGGHGGGLYLLNSSVQLAKCKITGNSAGRGGNYDDFEYVGGHAGNGGHGGGIFVYNSSVNVIDSRIANNWTGAGGDVVNGYGTPGDGGCGGGIFASNASVIDISVTVITSNYCLNGGYGGGADPGNGGNGGGIYCVSSSITVSDAGVTDNRAGPFFGDGGGIWLSNCSLATFANCVITYNIAFGLGGGMMVGGNVNIRNSTITSNLSTSPEPYSSGLYVYSGNQTIIDSIVWDNVVGSANITFSDVEGGWSGTGNINADPCFVSTPDGAYFLSQIDAGQASNSPCVDAGSASAISLGMDKLATRTDQVCDNGIVDMGYHYQAIFGSPDLNNDLFVDFNDFAILALQWLQTPGVPSADIAPPQGIVNESDLARMFEYWLSCFVGQATGPQPPNNSVNVSSEVTLSWSAGIEGVSHDIYFGTDATEVANGTGDTYKGRQTSTTWDPCGLEYSTKYYWRVDEVGPKCITKGNIWNFITRTCFPGQAECPQPADNAVNVSSEVTLSWSAPIESVSHDIYFGTDANEVANGTGDTYKGRQTSTTWDPCGLESETTYYWRVDEVSGCMAKGNIWSFTTCCGDVNSFLVSWWKFDEGQGGTAYDAAGNNNGTLYGDATWTTGIIDGGMQFRGNGWVNVPNPLSLNITGEITISVWYKPSTNDPAINNNRQIVSKWLGSDNAYTLGYGDIPNYIWLVINADNNVRAYSAVPVNDTNEWYHIAGVYNGSEQIVYINGVAGSSYANTGNIHLSSQPLRISGYPSGFKPLYGTVDDIRIYNRALTDEEILQIYHEVSP